MNQEIKKRWVDALRSGEYKQTKNKLRDGDSFCVFGVLCDLHAKETGNKWSGNAYLNFTGYPHKTVTDWAEIDLMKRIETNTHIDRLSDLNDNGYSFSQLADLIEEQL